MQKEAASQLALQLLEQHGLLQQGWRFRFDRARTRFGCCNYRERVISLSPMLTASNDETAVRETLLHEIAHALVGPRAGHGPQWKQKAQEIGCSGARCHSAELPPGKWQARCQGCGRLYHRHRKPSRKYSCGQCSSRFNPAFLLEFKLASI